jgi:hypothetical protein
MRRHIRTRCRLGSQKGAGEASALEPLLALDGTALIAQRRQKFIEMGQHGL